MKKCLSKGNIASSVISIENSETLKYHASSIKSKFFLLFVERVAVIKKKE